MVDFLTLMQHTFRKFQLKAEIALLDRELTNRLRRFGIELYDIIEKQRRSVIAQLEKDGTTTDPKQVDDIQQILKVFQTIENEIKIPLEVTRTEIDNMESSTPIKFPPLLIQRRKEEFGITIWPIICEETLWIHETLEKDLLKDANSSNNNNNNKTTKTVGEFMNTAIKSIEKGTKSTIKKAVGKLSSEQREVEVCVDVTKLDISLIENTILNKYNEIDKLINNGTTLECC